MGRTYYLHADFAVSLYRHYDVAKRISKPRRRRQSQRLVGAYRYGEHSHHLQVCRLVAHPASTGDAETDVSTDHSLVYAVSATDHDFGVLFVLRLGVVVVHAGRAFAARGAHPLGQ